MPFSAVLLGYIEDALSECFNYHSALDNFLIRAGLESIHLNQARSRANVRAQESGRGYAKGPKRFVVQEVLSILAQHGSRGDILISSFVTNLLKGRFPDAAEKGLNAIEAIRAQFDADREEKVRIRLEKEQELRDRENAQEQERQDQQLEVQKEKDSLRDRFSALSIETDLQKRGYLLEKFLYDLFVLEGVDPKASFKIVGEQIDGSILWNGHVYLVEAKWVKKPVAGAEFGAFMYKLGGKTVDTRGLYISINGYSEEAVTSLNGKGNLRFVCLDGTHIMRCFGVGQSLKNIIECVWRHASETGEAYLAACRMNQV